MTTRRNLLKALLACGAGPAIVRVSSLMPLQPVPWMYMHAIEDNICATIYASKLYAMRYAFSVCVRDLAAYEAKFLIDKLENRDENRPVLDSLGGTGV